MRAFADELNKDPAQREGFSLVLEKGIDIKKLGLPAEFLSSPLTNADEVRVYVTTENNVTKAHNLRINYFLKSEEESGVKDALPKPTLLEQERENLKYAIPGGLAVLGVAISALVLKFIILQPYNPVNTAPQPVGNPNTQQGK